VRRGEGRKVATIDGRMRAATATGKRQLALPPGTHGRNLPRRRSPAAAAVPIAATPPAAAIPPAAVPLPGGQPRVWAGDEGRSCGWRAPSRTPGRREVGRKRGRGGRGRLTCVAAGGLLCSRSREEQSKRSAEAVRWIPSQ
jgi:hypothetical protein